jgi:acyl dehydratase
MSVEVSDPLRDEVAMGIGKPMSGSGIAPAPDEVNLPMIRHWVDALDDRNPVYLDEEQAAESRFGRIVAPPAMLQTWTMGRPQIAGIAERGGAAGAIDPDSPLGILTAAGFTGTLATNSELEFERYLHLGDRVEAMTTLESISHLKHTGLGMGYFVTWRTRYSDASSETVGSQRFRILKFNPSMERPTESRPGSRPSSEGEIPAGEALPPLEIDVTATVIVAGAIASRDFMPVHHDREYARAQGAPDIFMNILTTNGYIARYVTDWAGSGAMLRSIAIRLGAPAIPGYVLRLTGKVTKQERRDGERVVEVGVRAANQLGAHATGSVTVSLLDTPART